MDLALDLDTDLAPDLAIDLAPDLGIDLGTDSGPDLIDLFHGFRFRPGGMGEGFILRGRLGLGCYRYVDLAPDLAPDLATDLAPDLAIDLDTDLDTDLVTDLIDLFHVFCFRPRRDGLTRFYCNVDRAWVFIGW